MVRHIRHIHILAIAVLLISSLLSLGAPGVGRNAGAADSHLDFISPVAELSHRVEVAKADHEGGQIGLLSHTRGQVC